MVISAFCLGRFISLHTRRTGARFAGGGVQPIHQGALAPPWGEIQLLGAHGRRAGRRSRPKPGSWKSGGDGGQSRGWGIWNRPTAEKWKD